MIRIGTKRTMSSFEEAAITPAEKSNPSPGRNGKTISPVSRKMIRNNTRYASKTFSETIANNASLV
jgi:hypothetical protein